MFNPFKKKLTSKGEYFLGLVLKEDEGEIFIFQVKRAELSVVILDQKQFYYTNSWEHLIDDVDANLFELEQKNNVHVERVVFFPYSHLIDQTTHHVQKPYLSKIKSIVEELELTIEGYAEFHESIALYLKELEQTPLTAIIIEIDKPAISLFIYKGGNLMTSQTVTRTQDIVSDLEEAFTKLKGDYLPSRVVLYDSATLQDESTKLITHSWNEGLFMQIPKFEIFAKEKINQVLRQSFSKQLFAEAASKNILSAPEPQIMQTPTPAPVAAGFVIGEDIVKEASIEKEAEIPRESFEELIPQRKNLLRKLILRVQLLTSSMYNTVSSTHKKSFTLLLGGAGILLIALSCFSVLYFLHNAEVTVLFKSAPLEKEITIDGVVGDKSDSDKLAIEKGNAAVEASATSETTGTKTIGDKAKGNVTVFNMKTQERTLKKGTVLQTDGGTSFTLDSDIKVASASSSLTGEGNVTIITGKQKAGITAAEIGSKGNIAKDTKLKIEGVSSEDARAQADAVFTGGSEKEVQTVSKEDMTTLQGKVEQELKKKGDEIVKKNSSQRRTLADLTEITTTDKKYSKELSEEASSLSLTEKSDVEYYSYDDPELKTILQNTLKDAIEEGYELTPEAIQYSAVEAEREDDTISIKLKVSAQPSKKIDDKGLLSDVKGKRTPKLEEIIKDKYRASGYEVHIDSPLPFLRSLMPFFTKNIQVHIKSL